MIKGLTILELVVVGLITALVISLGYNGVLMIQRLNIQKKELHAVISSAEQLNQLLKYNMLMSDTVLWIEDEQTLDFGSNQLKLEDMIYAHNGVADTLSIQLSDKVIKKAQISSELSVVESVALTIEVDSVSLIIYGEKTYSNYFLNGLDL